MDTASSVASKVIEASKALVGTWSPDYLAEISNDLKNLKTSSIDNFVQELLEYAAEEKTTNDARLKIAQLLMSLRSFFLPKISSSLGNKYELLETVLDAIHEGKLKVATAQLYTNIMSISKCSRPVKLSSKQPHKKSNSVQPTSESTKFEIEQPLSTISAFLV